MNHSTRLIGLTFALGLASLSAPALANDDDKAACAGKAQGDPCTDGDGDSGVCVPDESDPVLTCEDDAGSSSGTGTSSGTGSSGTGSGSGVGGGDDGSSSGTASTSGGSDDDGSDDDSSGGCSAAAHGSASSTGLLVGLVALGAACVRRRRP